MSDMYSQQQSGHARPVGDTSIPASREQDYDGPSGDSIWDNCAPGTSFDPHRVGIDLALRRLAPGTASNGEPQS
jgi:hypothetical protein